MYIVRNSILYLSFLAIRMHAASDFTLALARSSPGHSGRRHWTTSTAGTA
jgi:hypothetical protein